MASPDELLAYSARSLLLLAEGNLQVRLYLPHVRSMPASSFAVSLRWWPHLWAIMRFESLPHSQDSYATCAVSLVYDVTLYCTTASTVANVRSGSLPTYNGSSFQRPPRGAGLAAWVYPGSMASTSGSVTSAAFAENSSTCPRHVRVYMAHRSESCHASRAPVSCRVTCI